MIDSSGTLLPKWRWMIDRGHETGLAGLAKVGELAAGRSGKLAGWARSRGPVWLLMIDCV